MATRSSCAAGVRRRDTGGSGWGNAAEKLCRPPRNREAGGPFGYLIGTGETMPAFVYDVDPTHSSAHFSVRHLMISNVKGEFTKVSGTVTYDPDNPKASKVQATIDVNSLHTRDEQ